MEISHFIQEALIARICIVEFNESLMLLASIARLICLGRIMVVLMAEHVFSFLALNYRSKWKLIPFPRTDGIYKVNPFRWM